MELNPQLPELQPEQRQILDGLQEFGEQIADFYLDAIVLRNQTGLKTKSHLLAHLAREINNALIKTLIPADNKPKQEVKKDVDNASYKLIADFLGTELGTDFVQLWKKSTKDFHWQAHYKSGAYESTREADSFDEKWDTYQYKILLPIVGSRASRHDYVRRAIQLNKPEERATILTLKNLCRVQSNSRYFFENLKDTKWLVPLYENGFFEYETIPNATLGEDFKRVEFWNPLIYLLWVSSTDLTNQPELVKTIIIILKKITKQHTTTTLKIDNYKVWWNFHNILINLPLNAIDNELINNIRLWLIEDFDPHLASHDLILKLLPRFLKQGLIANYKNVDCIYWSRF